jgi:hypothetical protein
MESYMFTPVHTKFWGFNNQILQEFLVQKNLTYVYLWPHTKHNVCFLICAENGKRRSDSVY